MKIVSSPSLDHLNSLNDSMEKLFLYGRSDSENIFSCGAAIKELITKEKLLPHPLAWDFMSIALTVLSADFLVKRNESPDGWTREIEIDVAVSNTTIWNSQKALVENMLGFLTTDIWKVSFSNNGYNHSLRNNEEEIKINSDCITLLSGGMDSLIGLIDLNNSGKNPLVISQTVSGDKSNQQTFTKAVNASLKHLQLNHNISCRGENSTRSRSIIFLAYGILAGSCLENYKNGQKIKQYICENGLISLNIPLTKTRVGSLSTRTTNPIYINYLQTLLNNLRLNFTIENPYQFKTKGEMCVECKDQVLLKKLAKSSTSCGRFARYGFTQCGRCFPCLIRRASFKQWKVQDRTGYFYKNLGIKDHNHAGFDDVRSAAIAILDSDSSGFDSWIGPALSNPVFKNQKKEYEDIVKRGLNELKTLLRYYKVI